MHTMRLSFIIVVLIALPFAGLFANGQSEVSKSGAVSQASSARILYVEGEVTINGKPAIIGDLVKDGSVLKTGKDGQAQVTFNDSNIIAISPKAVVTLSLETLKRAVKLDQGGLSFVVKKLAYASGGGLQFQTPSAAGGVRGTCFELMAQENGKTYFCLCNGGIEISDSQGKQTAKIIAEHHKSFYYEPQADGTVKIVNAPVLYHDDAAMEGLAAKVNEKVDWTKADTHD